MARSFHRYELAGRMLPFGGRHCARGNGVVRLVDKAFSGLWAGLMCREPALTRPGPRRTVGLECW
jgi:hypothetical protein